MGPDRRIERLALAPIGNLPLIAQVAQRMSQLLPIPCRVLGDPPPIELMILEGREQADADRLLTALESEAHDPNQALCGLTMEDIGHPLFTHFFGRARRHGRAMVVSLARLSPSFYGLPADEELLLRRATREILHELGHLTGLLHCDDYRCIMQFAPTVERIDSRGAWFCERCAQQFGSQIPVADCLDNNPNQHHF
ncbi:MAG: hypothetical protein ACYTEG_12800 [Planctomycetota bacterium]|jgi:archaemetzincin